MLLPAGCANLTPDPFTLSEIPPAYSYCLEAQRIVTRTNVPMELVVHEQLATFVRAKTNIEGPTIHQFNWRDSEGKLQAFSCKMKNADHLQLTFGTDAAGPDGVCQDMNIQVYKLVRRQTANVIVGNVIFDQSESSAQKKKVSMPGPDWLMPYTMTYFDDAGDLHVAAKGFIIEFADPRFQKMPATWRGTHYCHLIAPDYLAALLQGKAEAGATVGREVERRINR